MSPNPSIHLVGLDYALIAVYLLLLALVGLFFGWFVKDVGNYLKGGNTLPWLVASVSNFMSMFTAFVFVAYAGIAYEHGLVAVTIFQSTVVACGLAGGFMAARWRRAQLVTPVEYLERRFNLATRQTFSWVGLLLRFLDNAVRLYALGLFLATVTPLSLVETIVLSGVIITAFTLLGGLWAVTVMDTIQFVVLLLATLILLPLALKAAGGGAGLATAAPDSLRWFNGPKGTPLWLAAYYLMICLKYNGNWAFIQRLYAVRDEAASRKVAWGAAVLFAVTPVIFLLPAIAARVVLPELADPEQAYVAMCARLLPAGLMGLMVAGMFSATMSSLNSEFNVMAGVLTNDFFKRLLAPTSNDRAQLVFARVMTLVVGSGVTVGAMFVGHFGGAFEANKLLTSIFGIPLAVPLVFGLLFRRPNATGALLVVSVGAAFALTLNIGGWFSWEVSTLLTVVVCLALFFLSGWLSPSREAGVRGLFDQLQRPLSPEQIPQINAGFATALSRLFALAFLVTGGLFLAVSVFSLRDLSGQLACAAGLACGLLGVLCWRRMPPPPSPSVAN